MMASYNPQYIAEMELKTEKMIAAIKGCLLGEVAENKIPNIIVQMFDTTPGYAHNLVSDVKKGVYDNM